MVGIFSRLSGYRRSHSTASLFLDIQETKVPLRGEIGEVGFHSAAGVHGNGVEVNVDFKPIDHPSEPPDEDRPVKCPMPGSSVLNDGEMREDQFAESLRKRAELSLQVNEEDMMMVATGPPARARRKRHHTPTRDHAMPPLLRRPPLPPQQIQNTTIFQVLQQSDEHESCQDT